MRTEKSRAFSDAEFMRMSHKGMEPTPSSFRSEVFPVGCSLSSSIADLGAARRHALLPPSVEIISRPGPNPTLTLLANARNLPSHGAHGTIHHGFQAIPNRSPAVSTLMTRGNTQR